MNGKDLQQLIQEIPAQELARLTGRNGGSAKRDKTALLSMTKRVEERLEKIGITAEYRPLLTRSTSGKKFKAWQELYGDQEEPEVSWESFLNNYAFGTDPNGNYLAYKMPK